jgi:hypothetical protein
MEAFDSKLHERGPVHAKGSGMLSLVRGCDDKSTQKIAETVRRVAEPRRQVDDAFVCSAIRA